MLFAPSTEDLYSQWLRGEIPTPWTKNNLYPSSHPLFTSRLAASSFHHLFLGRCGKVVVVQIPTENIDLSRLSHRSKSSYTPSHNPEFTEFHLPINSRVRVEGSRKLKTSISPKIENLAISDRLVMAI